MLKDKEKVDKLIFYGGNIAILLMMYGVLIYLLKFIAPQLASFITEIAPIQGLTKEQQYDHALNYAIAIEVCIFILTAIGESGAAKWFMGISIVTQLLFMHRWDLIIMKSVWDNPLDVTAGFRLLFGSVFVSAMSPVAMWYVSEKIKHILDILRGKAQQKQTVHEQRLARVEQTLANVEQKIISQETEFECPICHVKKATQHALNAHMKVHSDRNLKELLPVNIHTGATKKSIFKQIFQFLF